MAEDTIKLVVDIGAAIAALEANPELGATMNELVGGEIGKQLNAAWAEIERLHSIIGWCRRRLETQGYREILDRLLVSEDRPDV